MLNQLFQGVQRAGPVFTGKGSVVLEDKGYRVVLQLAPGAFNENAVGFKMKRALNEYIRSYLKECGWRAKDVSFRHGRLELAASPWPPRRS